MTCRMSWITVVMIAVAGQSEVQATPFQELVFIDHQNLRYVEEPGMTRFQVEAIKRNIDQAKKCGVKGYLLFAKETMEAMLTYDFEVPGTGNIGAQAFPPDSKHRRQAERLRQALGEVVEYARRNEVRLYFHSNQFVFPKEVLEVIRPATWGTAVCPGREATWAVYRGKIDELFRLFPALAGVQITGDETQVSVLKCACEKCRDLSVADRVRRLTNETAAVAKRYTREVQMRTWQRMGELGDPADMEQGILDNVLFSIKNTDGDFRLPNGLDRKFLSAAAPGRLVCEFDAWREYEGHNYFPCWMGALWAPRFQFLAQRGIPRIAVRLMWNSNANPIFARPWGNFVNLYAFLKLAESPGRPGGEILEDFVREYYPPAAREAARELYRYSTQFQRTMYYLEGQYLANHSRVQDQDAEDNLKDLQDDGFLRTAEDFAARRREIASAYEKAVVLIDRLGPEVPPEWIEGLRKGARVQQNVALATCDKLEAIYLQGRQKAGADVTPAWVQLRRRVQESAREWQAWDPASYKAMEGEAALGLFEPSR